MLLNPEQRSILISFIEGKCVNEAIADAIEQLDSNPYHQEDKIKLDGNVQTKVEQVSRTITAVKLAIEKTHLPFDEGMKTQADGLVEVIRGYFEKGNEFNRVGFFEGLYSLRILVNGYRMLLISTVFDDSVEAKKEDVKKRVV